MARKTVYSLWESVIPEWVCDGIVESGYSLKEQLKAQFNENPYEETDPSLSEDDDFTSPFWEPKNWINGLMMQYATMASEELWQYSLACSQGTRFESMETENGSNDWHSDEFDEPFGSESPPMWQGLARKITVLTNLSDSTDFDGGDFEFKDLEGTPLVNEDDRLVMRKKGTVIVFPSYIYYRLTPVNNGEKCYTITWILGPPFK